MLPSVAGFPFGGRIENGGFRYLKLQIHYHNPLHVAGLADRSGLKISYTAELRSSDMGVLALGDPAVTQERVLRPGNKSIHFEYECPSWCTQTWQSPSTSKLTVISSLLHMHETGSRMWTGLYRNNRLVREVGRVDFYDFNFQTQLLFEKPFEILPGDRLNTHCIFDTTGRTTDTEFGAGSQDEMCIDFLMYYPKVDNAQACGFIDGARLGKPGQDHSMCGMHPDAGSGRFDYRPGNLAHPTPVNTPSFARPENTETGEAFACSRRRRSYSEASAASSPEGSGAAVAVLLLGVLVVTIAGTGYAYYQSRARRLSGEAASRRDVLRALEAQQ
jgi:Copper type II ascorbate-dependent monooxygenase, C-terminal domain